MSLPTVDEGLGFITYDDVATNSALLSKQQSDLSGNVTQRQFCIDAFHLAGNRDVSNALIVSDDITTETDNVLAFIGSNVKSVQRTYLSNINISTKNQLFAINAYDMTYGISKLNPLNSKFLVAPFTQLTQKKIVASDRGAGDQFGYSVAISGNYAIVGANQEYHDESDDNPLEKAGSAYIFERTNGSWSQKQKIVASDRGAGDEFGYSVAISGNYAIVGAYKEDHDASGNVGLSAAGSAYIFEIDTNGSWNEVQKIVASDRGGSDQFGYSVAISGNYAIVGANRANQDRTLVLPSLNNAGSAYIFERTNGSWSEKQKIVASDRGEDDYFGNSVAISGNYAIVGAYLENPVVNSVTKSNAGSAYIFEIDTSGNWSQKQKIVASDRGISDQFGRSVAISGNYAIVGASREDHDASGDNELTDAGSAYIFEIDTSGNWSQKQKIVASDRQADDYFGTSVAISGNYAIVGAYLEDPDSSGNVINNAGSAYIFERTNGSWNQIKKIVASDRAATDYFGWSVAISGNYAIVGAHAEDHDAIGDNEALTAGAAYIFEG